jgi:hypothetical protein
MTVIGQADCALLAPQLGRRPKGSASRACAFAIDCIPTRLMAEQTSYPHIRRIFARMSIGSRNVLSPRAASLGDGHERLSNLSSTDSGMKRVRCA